MREITLDHGRVDDFNVAVEINVAVSLQDVDIQSAGTQMSQ